MIIIIIYDNQVFMIIIVIYDNQVFMIIIVIRERVKPMFAIPP